jgi:hypothetical protein
MSGDLVEVVRSRHEQLRQAAERAAEAPAVPIKLTGQMMERRIMLVRQSMGFVAAAKAAGVAPVVETDDMPALLRVSALFFRLAREVARLLARSKEQRYIGVEFRAVEDAARDYADAIRDVQAHSATITFAAA